MWRSRSQGGTGGPVKAKAIALRREMPVKAAFRAVMAAGRVHLKANERGVIDARDPEYLHQVRVALRRLRSTVEIFDPLLPALAVDQVRRGIRWLGAELGPARDWDVLMTRTLPQIEREYREARSGLATITAHCEVRRRRAHARASRAIRSPRYRRLQRALVALVDSADRPPRLAETAAQAVLVGPVSDFASAILERRYEQVRKKGRGIGALSSRELHRLRIAIKKFRYAADFFTGMYRTGRARGVRKRLARLQDILGSMNDAETASILILHEADDRRDARAARDAIFEWGRHRAKRLGHELNDAWREFSSVGRFW